MKSYKEDLNDIQKMYEDCYIIIIAHNVMFGETFFKDNHTMKEQLLKYLNIPIDNWHNSIKALIDILKKDPRNQTTQSRLSVSKFKEKIKQTKNRKLKRNSIAEKYDEIKTGYEIFYMGIRAVNRELVKRFDFDSIKDGNKIMLDKLDRIAEIWYSTLTQLYDDIRNMGVKLNAEKNATTQSRLKNKSKKNSKNKSKNKSKKKSKKKSRNKSKKKN